MCLSAVHSDERGAFSCDILTKEATLSVTMLLFNFSYSV